LCHMSDRVVGARMAITEALSTRRIYLERLSPPAGLRPISPLIVMAVTVAPGS
jgi:hypothetical protein